MSSKLRRDLPASSATAKALWRLATVFCLVALIAGIVWLRPARMARHDVAALAIAPAEKTPTLGGGAGVNAAASQTPAAPTPRRFAERQPHPKSYERQRRGLAKALPQFRQGSGRVAKPANSA